MQTTTKSLALSAKLRLSAGTCGWLSRSLARRATPCPHRSRTRIAHIDTGYDRNHAARPERVILEHSFVEDDLDPTRAEARAMINLLPKNLDHGTGTIGVLAGGRVSFLNNDYLGGAPQADIVTLRIADSVIMFRVSAFAQALQFAVDNNCDVVSISRVDCPSRAWSGAVNRAYQAGICICAAAGSNIRGLPDSCGLSARYHRAIAVYGVMANGQPLQIGGRNLQGVST
jgi:subtilisin family serine protease